MTLEEQLKFCSICSNRKMDRLSGLICQLTNEKPAFIDNCPSFSMDSKESDRKHQLELNAAGNIKTDESSSPKYLTTIGAILFVLAIPLLFLSLKLGIVMIITGIGLMIKGDRQKEIIAEHNEFKKKHHSD